MQTHIVKLASVVAGVALAAAIYALPAAAAERRYDVHHRVVHRTHYRVESSDITVRKSASREPVAAAPDAFHGPAAIITAPIYVAGTFVSLPFRAFEVVFPSRANDPRVLIGAPVHFVGQIAEFPFTAVNGAFGVGPAYSTYN